MPFPFKLGYIPALFAPKALAVKFLAALFASFAPIPPGTPICIKLSVSLPIALCSATSSNGFSLSKNSSTLAAVSVSAPRSISSAARDTTPSGTFKIPEATPAANDLYQDTSLSFSIELRGMNSDI